MSMNSEGFKAWLDAMPIDDVRRKIERLEAKIADLRVLERIYADRHESPAAQPEGEAGGGQPEGEGGGEAKPEWQEPA
jgi:hypothetical protein